jgi:hypothetical protein
VDLDVDSGAEDEPDATADVMLRDRIGRRLEHVFTLLSLHAEREPLRMALRALHHEDAHHRGTALEYLSATLEADVRNAVWPLLGEKEALETVRSADEVLAALVHAAPAQPRS